MPDSNAAPARLSAQALDRYLRDGFVVIEGITTAEEIARARLAYDRLFAARHGFDRGEFFDTYSSDETHGELRLPQMFWPSHHDADLRDTLFERNATAIARQVLGGGAKLVWEFAMLKPAHTGAETPWHQDEAYFTRGTEYQDAVSFWLPLQDVGPHNGCMEFVPGSHREALLPHRRVGGDARAHGLEAMLAAPPRAEVCPLSVGSATLHHSRVMHHAGPNPSAEPRRAWILEYAVRDPARRLRHDHAWNRGRTTAREARELASLPLAARLRRILRRPLSLWF